MIKASKCEQCGYTKQVPINLIGKINCISCEQNWAYRNGKRMGTLKAEPDDTSVKQTDADKAELAEAYRLLTEVYLMLCESYYIIKDKE